MFYAWNITLPKGKDTTAKTKRVLYLEKGTITRFELTFPMGCCGLVYVHVNDALYQVYPKDASYQFTGNGQTIVSSDEFEIKEEPYQLNFYGWNEDEKYDHTVTVRIQLVPAKEIIRRVIGGLSDVMKLTKPS